MHDNPDQIAVRRHRQSGAQQAVKAVKAVIYPPQYS
jgi:hypothetical protein